MAIFEICPMEQGDNDLVFSLGKPAMAEPAGRQWGGAFCVQLCSTGWTTECVVQSGVDDFAVVVGRNSPVILAIDFPST